MKYTKEEIDEATKLSLVHGQIRPDLTESAVKGKTPIELAALIWSASLYDFNQHPQAPRAWNDFALALANLCEANSKDITLQGTWVVCGSSDLYTWGLSANATSTTYTSPISSWLYTGWGCKGVFIPS